MNTEKAKFLNAYFVASLKVFDDALLQKPIRETEIGGKSYPFNQAEFDTLYPEFLVELEEVMKETRNIHISYDYASVCLNDIKTWKGFPENQNKQIFSVCADIGFLINLKRDIETMAHRVTQFVRRDKNGDYDGEFYAFYFKIIISSGTEEVISATKENMIRIEKNQSARVFNQYHFNLADLMIHCEELPNTVSKLNYMQDKLYDFKIMLAKTERDNYIKERIVYTPDFENLCLLQIERHTKKLELEIKVLAVRQIETLQSLPPTTAPSYRWKANDTDLPELVAALHKENIIERNDQKELTRKELIELFSGLFYLQIKDVDGKLFKATTRYDKTPFLDRLKKGFENYGLEKEEKQRLRK